MRRSSRFLITAGAALGVMAVWAPGAGAATFTNATPIPIPNQGQGPHSLIVVSGQTAPISGIAVRVNGYSQGASGDTSLVLAAPGGQALLLMNCVGGEDTAASDVDLRLEDSVGLLLPHGGPLVSGAYRPANHCSTTPTVSGLTIQNPGPGLGGSATLASTFHGIAANGAWSLIPFDCCSGGGPGQIAGGWALELSPDPATPAPKKKKAKKKCKKGKKKKGKKGKCKKKKKKGKK